MSDDTLNYKTSHLFAMPSFVEGIGRILDFSGSLNQYNSSPSGEDADLRAVSADWFAVGDDLKNALEEYHNQYVSERETED